MKIFYSMTVWKDTRNLDWLVGKTTKTLGTFTKGLSLENYNIININNFLYFLGLNIVERFFRVIIINTLRHIP